MNITVELDQASVKLLETLHQNLDAKTLLHAVYELFDKLSSRAAGWVVRTQLSGQALKRRTGGLARSIVGRAEMRGSLPAMRVGVFRGPASRYAGVMEHGTKGANAESPYDTIRPRNARALAMPVGEALTPAGVARYQSPRQYPGGLAYVPALPRRTSLDGEGGTQFNAGASVGGLYDRDSLRAAGHDLSRARLLYVLLKKLDVPAHHYLRNGMRTFIPQVMPELTSLLKGMISGLQSSR